MPKFPQKQKKYSQGNFETWKRAKNAHVSSKNKNCLKNKWALDSGKHYSQNQE